MDVFSPCSLLHEIVGCGELGEVMCSMALPPCQPLFLHLAQVWCVYVCLCLWVVSHLPA